MRVRSLIFGSLAALTLIGGSAQAGVIGILPILPLPGICLPLPIPFPICIFP